MLTAKQKIIDILYRDGVIDNYFVIDNRITTRLGAYINSLSKKGWEFTGEFLKGTKNYQYIVVKYPSETDTKTATSGNSTRQVLREVLPMSDKGSSTTPQPYLFGTATEL